VVKVNNSIFLELEESKKKTPHDDNAAFWGVVVGLQMLWRDLFLRVIFGDVG